MRYFKSGENIALYNLAENECEIHTLEDAKTGFIISAEDDKISVWLEANENRVVECDSMELVNSVQMVFSKTRLLNKIKKTDSRTYKSGLSYL